MDAACMFAPFAASMSFQRAVARAWPVGCSADHSIPARLRHSWFSSPPVVHGPVCARANSSRGQSSRMASKSLIGRTSDTCQCGHAHHAHYAGILRRVRPARRGGLAIFGVPPTNILGLATKRIRSVGLLPAGGWLWRPARVIHHDEIRRRIDCRSQSPRSSAGLRPITVPSAAPPRRAHPVLRQTLFRVGSGKTASQLTLFKTTNQLAHEQE